MTEELPEDPTAVLFRRVLAHLVDALLYMVAFAVPALLLATSTSAPGVDTSSLADRFDLVGDDLTVFVSNEAYTFDRTDQLIAAAIVLGVALLNGVILQGATGMTAGKAVFGLRAVRPSGDPPGFLRAFGRQICWIIDGLPSFLLPVVGGFLALLTRGRRRLGDFVAGTFVVAKRFAGAPILGADGDADVDADQSEDDTLFAPAPAMEDLAPAATGTGPIPEIDPPAAAAAAAAGATAGTTLPGPDEAEASDLFTEPAPRSALFGGLAGPAEAGEGVPGEAAAPESDIFAAAPPAGAAAAGGAGLLGESAEPNADDAAGADDAGPVSTAAATAPEWDAARKAYIYWEPARQEWLQHDAEADEWVPISRA